MSGFGIARPTRRFAVALRHVDLGEGEDTRIVFYDTVDELTAATIASEEHEDDEVVAVAVVPS